MVVEVYRLLLGALTTSIPLLVASLGELVLERTGKINLGLEGMIAVGAAFGVLVGSSTGSLSLAFLAAILAGVSLSLVYTVLVVFLGVEQVIVGLSIVFAGLGIADIVGNATKGIPAPYVEDPRPLAVAVLAVVIVAWLVLERSWVGVEIRAIGESEERALERGLRVKLLRAHASIFSGACAGAAGALIALSIHLGKWFSGITSGWGWLSLGIVILGYWNPVGVLGASYLVGALLYTRPLLPSLGMPAQLADAAPYIAIILLLVIVSRLGGEKARPPTSVWRKLL